jgi:hypothetical protein
MTVQRHATKKWIRYSKRVTFNGTREDKIRRYEASCQRLYELKERGRSFESIERELGLAPRSISRYLTPGDEKYKPGVGRPAMNGILGWTESPDAIEDYLVKSYLAWKPEGHDADYEFYRFHKAACERLPKDFPAPDGMHRCLPLMGMALNGPERLATRMANNALYATASQFSKPELRQADPVLADALTQYAQVLCSRAALLENEDTPAAMVPMSMNHTGEICCYKGLNRQENKLVAQGIEKLLDSIEPEFDERYAAIANALDVQEALMKAENPQWKRLANELVHRADRNERFADDLRRAFTETSAPQARQFLERKRPKLLPKVQAGTLACVALIGLSLVAALAGWTRGVGGDPSEQKQAARQTINLATRGVGGSAEKATQVAFAEAARDFECHAGG